ncbi:MAG: HAD-IIIC family phosphatase [Alphaproteobacteria bacterium]|nr:HAD-IIIC family phosphatase [Alphaproteobacteria bacterium]
MDKHPLDYPWDFEDLFMQTRRFLKRREELCQHSGTPQQARVQIIGGYTTDILENWIHIFAAYYGVELTLDTSDWGAAFSLAGNVNSLDQVDMILCLNDHRDLIIAGKRNHSVIGSDLVMSQISDLITRCGDHGVAISMTDFCIPQAGPPSGGQQASIAQVASDLNMFLQQQAQKHPLLNVLSLNQFSALSEEPLTATLRNWYQFGHTLSVAGSIVMAQAVARHLAFLKGLGKKALVVDLDNTLWGGVIGDDGVEGIELGQETPRGRIFSDIQSHLLRLKERGVLLAIASKNNEDIAREAFDHPSSILKWSDFSVHKANWEPKSSNIKDIANHLNIGLDSLVFIDDNPAERAEVRTHLPMVTIPDCGENPEDQLAALLMLDPFSQNTPLTKEDLLRNNSFQDNSKREQLMKDTADPTLFLKKIGTTVHVSPPESHEYARCLQLTNKTNQFNLTGHRLTQQEFNQIIADPLQDIFVARISDTFGDYGLTGVMYIQRKGSHAHINNWLMSCRVFSKTAEHAMFKAVATFLQDKGITSFSAEFIPLAKNRKFMYLLSDLGFSQIEDDKNNTDEPMAFELEHHVSQTLSAITHYCEIIV